MSRKLNTMGTIKSGSLERRSLIKENFCKRILTDLNLLSIIEMNVFDFLYKIETNDHERISQKVSTKKGKTFLMDSKCVTIHLLPIVK